MTSYHASAGDLRSWVDGTADGLVAVSVEQHVSACPTCQGFVAEVLSTTAVAAVPDLGELWRAVQDTLELGRSTRTERLLVRAGLSPTDATLVAAAPALRGSWLGAVALAASFVVAATLAGSTGGLVIFLMLAPLAPVLGVALCYGPESSPALEQESAAPYPLSRLVMLRSLAVLASSLPLVLTGQLLFPGHVSSLWLVPACGFAAMVLGLSTWFGPMRPAIAITVVWLTSVAVASRLDRATDLLDDGYLAVYVLMLMCGAPLFLVRSRRTGTIGRISP